MFARIIPAPLVRWFARPYVAGDSMAAGLDAAGARLREDGLLATMDLLGEDVTRREQVERNVAAYERLIDAIGSDPRFADAARRPSVSLKPSAFTIAGSPPESAREPVEALARRATDRGVALTIDMEDRRWTDFTLDLATSLFRGGLDVGTVLQTRLHRTGKDLERIPAGMRLRLVIGIYPEPAEVALVEKPPMKERMLEYAARLLDRGVRVEFATHDEPTLRRFLREVAPKAPGRCEIQMLLGVPRGRFLGSLRSGSLGPSLPARLYIPFALGWDDATAYLRRRMKESPSTVWLVLRNLLPR